jgi:hypothetical protein
MPVRESTQEQHTTAKHNSVAQQLPRGGIYRIAIPALQKKEAGTIQRVPAEIPVSGSVEEEEAFQLKTEFPMQRVRIPTGEETIFSDRKSDQEKVQKYLTHLYTTGGHKAIGRIRGNIAATEEPYQQEWLDKIDTMMQYGGLNKFVKNVSIASGAQNFAQGCIRLFDTGGTLAAAYQTAAKGSGDEGEEERDEKEWHTKGGVKDRKISDKDAEAQVCNSLFGQLKGDVTERVGKAEIHLVTYNGPCNACKARVNELGLTVKSKFGNKIPVYIRVYYIAPPREKERGRKEIKTYYGWEDDTRDERGLFTHDDQV